MHTNGDQQNEPSDGDGELEWSRLLSGVLFPLHTSDVISYEAQKYDALRLYVTALPAMWLELSLNYAAVVESIGDTS